MGYFFFQSCRFILQCAFETNNWKYYKTSYSVTDPELGFHVSAPDYNIGIELYSPDNLGDSRKTDELALTMGLSPQKNKTQRVPVYSLLIMYLKIIMRICPKSQDTIKGIREGFGKGNRNSCKDIFTYFSVSKI